MPDTHDQSTSSASMRGTPDPRAPLWATFSLTWVNNIGASVALMGVYFIANAAYRFTPTQSVLLALLQGVTYIAGALSAGPAVRRIAGPDGILSTRALTGVVMLLMGLSCWLPVLWRDPLSVWLLIAVYSPLSGWLWPLIESFMASGRSGAELRRATGSFNFSWSSCQFVTFWLLMAFMPPIPAGAEASPAQVSLALWSMPLLALSHTAALAFLLRLPKEPGTHHETLDEALTLEQRNDYKRLLTASRWLIIMGYVAYSATNPLLAARLESLGVSPKWHTPMVSIWMISRVCMFAFMSRWPGWHGRRHTLVWSGGTLLLGVTGMLLAPDPYTLSASLVLFGLGHGAIYSAAFYYAMEVGSAGVDAGGRHEALIGCGYTVGPLAALAAARIAESTGPEWRVEPLLSAAIAGLAVAAGFLAWRSVRTARPTPVPMSPHA